MVALRVAKPTTRPSLPVFMKPQMLLLGANAHGRFRPNEIVQVNPSLCPCVKWKANTNTVPHSGHALKANAVPSLKTKIRTADFNGKHSLKACRKLFAKNRLPQFLAGIADRTRTPNESHSESGQPSMLHIGNAGTCCEISTSRQACLAGDNSRDAFK